MRRGQGHWRTIAATAVAAVVTACGSDGNAPRDIVAPSVPLGWSDAELVAYVTRHLDRLSSLPDGDDWSDALLRADGSFVVTSAGGTVFVATRFADDAAGRAGGDALCDELTASLDAAADLPGPLHELVVTGETNAVLARCAPRVTSES